MRISQETSQCAQKRMQILVVPVFWMLFQVILMCLDETNQITAGVHFDQVHPDQMRLAPLVLSQPPPGLQSSAPLKSCPGLPSIHRFAERPQS
jgi:hypothetical protein